MRLSVRFELTQGECAVLDLQVGGFERPLLAGQRAAGLFEVLFEFGNLCRQLS